jgi:serine/threonine protein kinase
MRLEPGQRVGVYEIVGSLGAGGMGEVYEARDTRLGRPVAIKFVSDELAADRNASERLEREARLTSLLNHPNIVTVYDVGELDSRPYIVMELVAGQSLHSALQWERLKPGRVIEIASQIADGLAVAHAAGIVHRDLKPRNIMLTTDGRAKIVDFGFPENQPPSPGAEDLTARRCPTDTFVVIGTAGHGAGKATSKGSTPRGSVRAGRDHLRRSRAYARLRATPVQTMAAIVDTSRTRSPSWPTTRSSS